MTGEDVGRLFEGQTLQDRYYLKRLLAAGGFGAVFHAEHRVLGETVRQVAIKITLTTGLDRQNFRHVFGEAIMWARVYDRLEGSPVTRYLVPVYDMGILSEHEGRGFIVTGLVRGKGSTPARCVPAKTLAEIVRNWAEAGMPHAAAMEYMRRICEAVGALHDQGVIHRDLKPDNILLSEDGQARLIDFGLAADVEPDGYARGCVGTRQYTAPETGLENRSSRASDVYALGLIAYELLAGRGPFDNLQPPAGLTDGDAFTWMQREKASAPILAPSSYRQGVEPWQDRLVIRCLSAVASARPQDAGELRRAIESAGTGSGPSINGEGWSTWFEPPPGWAADNEAAVLEQFLASWGPKRRDAVWFEGATKLAVCYLSMPQIDTARLTQLLSSAEQLVRQGDVLASYEQRAIWYGGLASLMERKGRAGLLKSAYRSHEREARRHASAAPPAEPAR